MQADRARRVHFFTSRSPSGKAAFEQARAAHPRHSWTLHHVETADERARFVGAPPPGDLVLSFLNPFVIPASYLASSEGRCFNVHPATPDFPGRDPQHWAFYEGATEAGATLHHMDESVDSGEIVDVMTAPSPRSDGVMRHIERSEVLATQLLLRHLPALLADGVKPTADRQWRTQARRTRADFLRMCRLSPDLPADEIRRRIDAFYNPAHRSIHIDLHGYRFVYEPVDGRTDV